MEKLLAEQLLEIEAVFLKPNEPFTWSSGMLSPIYCDNRLTISYPFVRKTIAEGLANSVREQYPECELVAGTSTGGIAHAAWVSDILNLPMCYVRSKAKGHGKGKQIEGKYAPGQKVVIVEDLISTGGSVIKVVEALREAGCEVLGIVAIFSYNLSVGKEKLAAANVQWQTLTNYQALIEVALEKEIISEDDKIALQEWAQHPNEWQPKLAAN